MRKQAQVFNFIIAGILTNLIDFSQNLMKSSFMVAIILMEVRGRVENILIESWEEKIVFGGISSHIFNDHVVSIL